MLLFLSETLQNLFLKITLFIEDGKRTSFYRNILIKELRVTSYELISLRVFIARVMSYFYCTSYELLFAYELHFTYEYCLLHELRVTFLMQVASYCLLHKLRVIYTKDKDDKNVDDDKVMIKNYPLGSFFDKECMISM